MFLYLNWLIHNFSCSARIWLKNLMKMRALLVSPNKICGAKTKEHLSWWVRLWFVFEHNSSCNRYQKIRVKFNALIKYIYFRFVFTANIAVRASDAVKKGVENLFICRVVLQTIVCSSLQIHSTRFAICIMELKLLHQFIKMMTVALFVMKLWGRITQFLRSNCHVAVVAGAMWDVWKRKRIRSVLGFVVHLAGTTMILWIKCFMKEFSSQLGMPCLLFD